MLLSTMFRHIRKSFCWQPHRYIGIKNKSSKRTNFTEGDVAYETEYYCKKDKELMESLTRKTQREVKNMQDQVKMLHKKIEEYNRDIKENLRFLRDLEKGTSVVKKKGS